MIYKRGALLPGISHLQEQCERLPYTFNSNGYLCHMSHTIFLELLVKSDME
jgi:hypothetical protein